MSNIYTYMFSDPVGTDTLTITVSSTPSTISGGDVTGDGYAVTAISGTLDGTAITEEVGAPGRVQYSQNGGAIFDNAIFDTADTGGNYNGASGSEVGVDIYGFEFTVGSTEYNLYQQNGQFILYNVTSGITQNLTLTFTDAPCFCEGTLIRTPDGDIAVETLKAGDLVLLASGEAVPVRWVGTRKVAQLFADPLRVMPIRIKAGALGHGLPTRDLLVSPDHAVFIDNVLIQAGALVNGGSIVRETKMPQIFTYYHVETPEHSLLLAEGAMVESFVDNAGRMGFDNSAMREAGQSMNAPIAEMAYPRAVSARQVPASIPARLLGVLSAAEQAA